MNDQYTPDDRIPHNNGAQSTTILQDNDSRVPTSLTLHSLQQPDEQQYSTDPMALWLQEDMRTAPWNPVGYVKMEQERCTN